MANNIKNENINNIISEYAKDLEQKLEENKNRIKQEYENKLKIKLEEFQNKKGFLDISDSKDNYNEKKEIENEFYKQLNIIKKNNKEIQNKSNEIIKSLINKTSEIFEETTKNQSKDINLIFQKITQKIKNESKNIDNGIDDYLTEIITDKKISMSKYNSLVEMVENEFTKNKYLLQYFIDVFKIINQILSNNENTKDENKINEICKNVNNIIKDYKIKIEKEKNNKLFPFLY